VDAGAAVVSNRLGYRWLSFAAVTSRLALLAANLAAPAGL
jgi:hypothetical protein